MKKLIVITLALTMSATLFGQIINRKSEEKTLFGNAPLRGGFVAASAKPAFVNHQEAYIIGGQAALVFGEKVNIGVAGYGLLTDVGSNQFNSNGDEYFIEMGYSGLLFEPVFGSNRMIHITTPILLGGGVSALSVYRPWDYGYEYDEYTNPEFFFVAEPGVNAELNVFRFMRLAAGVSYRFVGETGVFQSTGTDLSGWSGQVTVKLGWF